VVEIYAIVGVFGVGVALGACTLVVCVLVVRTALRERHRQRIFARVAEGRCPKCGYSVAELSQCPECAFVIRNSLSQRARRNG
jgi:hypothetical protein